MIGYLLSKNRMQQARMFGLVVLAALTSLVPIHLFRLIIDNALPNRDLTLLIELGLVLLVVLLVRVALEYAKAIQARRIQEFFVSDLRQSLMAHIMNLPSEYFSTNPVGKLTNRIMHDVARFGMGVEWLLVNPAIAVATVVLYGAYLVSIEPALTLVAILPLPVVVWVSVKYSNRLSAHRSKVIEAQGTYSGSINEIMLGATEIQSNGAYQREQHRLQREHDALSTASIYEASLLARIAATSEAYRDVVPTIVYCYGGWLAIGGDLSIGRIVAFAAAFGGLYLGVDTLVNYMPLYQNVRDRYSELRKILEVPQMGPGGADKTSSQRPSSSPGPETPDVRGTLAQQAWEAALGVVAEGISFSHPNGARIINNVSFTIRSGEHVALIGHSGCGKSTLLNLIGGRLQPIAGTLRYAGTDHHRLTTEQRVSLISYVQQSPFLFSGILRDNLVYGVSHDPEQAKSLTERDLLAICAKTGLGSDLLAFGLEARIDGSSAENLIALRPRIEERLRQDRVAQPTNPLASNWDQTLSILENLVRGNYDQDDAGVARRINQIVLDCISDAGLADRLRTEGLRFDVGERGSRLSGGQRQKVSIARALLRQRPILLLDEATASLDEASARTVIGLLHSDLRDVTVIAITHELGLITDFDRVIALKNGELHADTRPGDALTDPGFVASVLDRNA